MNFWRTHPREVIAGENLMSNEIANTAQLASLFEESVEQVCARELNAIEYLLQRVDRRVVLVGAGRLGRRAQLLLGKLGANLMAFTDNNSRAWGTEIENLPVMPPTEAASRYGSSALFLVTIWNDRHWFRETYVQLTDLGCSTVSSYLPLFWRFPNDFLQLILLNDLPHKLYADCKAVLDAERLWQDEESLRIYRANIRWRALGDGLDMPGRPEANTYFPRELFRLDSRDRVLDCGAFDGDTIRQAFESYPSGFEAVHAIEADSLSYARLVGFTETLDWSIRATIHLHNCAIGPERGFVRFESDGSVNARMSESGALVELLPIDELFAQIPVTFIKMDIEGAEFGALMGARKVLVRDRPILGVCVYHTQSDIWRIPLLVREILPEHRLFLRAYEGDGFQTVLYALPPERQFKK
jgi:FkbM family methyltransferase